MFVFIVFLVIWATLGGIFQGIFFYGTKTFFNDFHMKYLFDGEGWVFYIIVIAIMAFAAYVIAFIHAEISARNITKDIAKEYRNRRNK